VKMRVKDDPAYHSHASLQTVLRPSIHLAPSAAAEPAEWHSPLILLSSVRGC